MSSRITIDKDGVLEQGGALMRKHTVTSAEATANQAVITLNGLPALDVFLVQILRSNVDVKEDAVVTASGKTLTIADGGTTYNMTAGDILMIYAGGTLAE